MALLHTMYQSHSDNNLFLSNADPLCTYYAVGYLSELVLFQSLHLRRTPSRQDLRVVVVIYPLSIEKAVQISHIHHTVIVQHIVPFTTSAHTAATETIVIQ